MSKTDPQAVENNEIRRYLYGEMSEAERDAFEARLLEDDGLFSGTADLENDLIDRYAAGMLSDDERARFERTFEHFPARRSRITTAAAMQELISEEIAGENEQESAAPAAPGVWQGIGQLFSFRSPVYGGVMTVLLAAAVVAGIYLYQDSRRANEQLAALKNEQSGTGDLAARRENELRGQIAEARKNIDDLKTQLSNKEQETDEFVRSLNTEQQRIQLLEGEMEKAGRDGPVPAIPGSTGPTIASLVLDSSGRDRTGGGLSTAAVGENTRKLAISLTLPEGVRDDEKYSLELNEKPFMQGVASRAGANGRRTISVIVPREALAAGDNKLVVLNLAGKPISEYEFKVDKP